MSNYTSKTISFPSSPTVLLPLNPLYKPTLQTVEKKKKGHICQYAKCTKKVFSQCAFCIAPDPLNFELCSDHKDEIHRKMGEIGQILKTQHEMKKFKDELYRFSFEKTDKKYYYTNVMNGDTFYVTSADELVLKFFEMSDVDQLLNPKKCLFVNNTWQIKDGHVYNIMITTIQNELLTALREKRIVPVDEQKV